jgi:hypothetical protein
MTPEIERALEVLKAQGDEIKFVFFAMEGQFFIASTADCSVVKVIGQLEVVKADLVSGIERHVEDVVTKSGSLPLDLAGGMF